jgi:hypothetical protein
MKYRGLIKLLAPIVFLLHLMGVTSCSNEGIHGMAAEERVDSILENKSDESEMEKMAEADVNFLIKRHEPTLIVAGTIAQKLPGVGPTTIDPSGFRFYDLGGNCTSSEMVYLSTYIVRFNERMLEEMNKQEAAKRLGAE